VLILPQTWDAVTDQYREILVLGGIGEVVAMQLLRQELT
jgi:hypothetical protein